ncbi:MAG: hypothetical protein ACK5OX_08800 [Desertimonas sp.]
MTKDDAVEKIHSAGFTFGGHAVSGGPWEVTLYRIADGTAVGSVKAPSWDEGVMALAADVEGNDQT